MSHINAELAEKSPNEFALGDERQTFNRKELNDTLNRAANALRDLGLPEDARVAVFARNSVECILAYQAALHAGISSVPISAHFTVDEVAFILENSGTQVLMVGPETVEVGRQAAERAGVKLVFGWRLEAGTDIQDWRAWIDLASADAPPDDIAPVPHLHYTSGTTGLPKGTGTPPALFPVQPTVRDFFETLKKGRPGLSNPSPAMIVSPLHHTGPLISMRLLGAGIAIYIMSRFDAETVLKQIDHHKIKGVMMVPTHFQRLLDLPEEVRKKYDVSSLDQVTHTGSACPRDVKHRMIEWFGPVLVEAYGATESGSTNMISSEEWLKKPGSVGKTMPPFEVVVVSEDGKELGVNEVGELYFRDTSGRGIIYHNNPEKTQEAHREPGVFTLGEMGYVDDDGYVFITDRVTDMIISGGVNIYPAEIEDVLSQHKEIDDIAIIGVPNKEMGEEVKALVIPVDAANPPTEEAIDSFCRERLAGYKCPRSYEYVDDIGRNPMGKVNKKALRKPYWPTDRTIGG